MQLLQAVTLIIVIVAVAIAYSLGLLGVLHAPALFAAAVDKIVPAMAIAPFLIPQASKASTAITDPVKRRYPSWVENAAAEIFSLGIDDRSEDDLKEIIAKHGFFELSDFDAGESDVSYQSQIQA